MPERLSRADWVAAGLEALAREGDSGLKAEPLARRLGVSRGSFYWHFADLDAFHEAVVTRWRDVAVDAVIRDLERHAAGDVEARLRRLVRLALQADPSLEIGMRAWLAERARAAVAAVDARRLVYLGRLLREAGIASDASEARALVIYWIYLGSALSRTRVGDDLLERLVDEVAALGLKGR